MLAAGKSTWSQSNARKLCLAFVLGAVIVLNTVLVFVPLHLPSPSSLPHVDPATFHSLPRRSVLQLVDAPAPVLSLESIARVRAPLITLHELVQRPANNAPLMEQYSPSSPLVFGQYFLPQQRQVVLFVQRVPMDQVVACIIGPRWLKVVEHSSHAVRCAFNSVEPTMYVGTLISLRMRNKSVIKTVVKFRMTEDATAAPVSTALAAASPAAAAPATTSTTAAAATTSTSTTAAAAAAPATAAAPVAAASTAASSAGADRFRVCAYAPAMARSAHVDLAHWASYYTGLGVEHFFLYDTQSTAEFASEVAKVNQEAKTTLIESLYWPWAHSERQMSTHAALAARTRCEWLLRVDLNDYLTLRSCESPTAVVSDSSESSPAATGASVTVSGCVEKYMSNNAPSDGEGAIGRVCFLSKASSAPLSSLRDSSLSSESSQEPDAGRGNWHQNQRCLVRPQATSHVDAGRVIERTTEVNPSYMHVVRFQ